jgi:hypothetical protein
MVHLEKRHEKTPDCPKYILTTTERLLSIILENKDIMTKKHVEN